MEDKYVLEIIQTLERYLEVSFNNLKTAKDQNAKLKARYEIKACEDSLKYWRDRLGVLGRINC